METYNAEDYIGHEVARYGEDTGLDFNGEIIALNQQTDAELLELAISIRDLALEARIRVTGVLSYLRYLKTHGV